MKKIYFLCTGNSCRSQMAEGYGKALLKDQYECRSTGVEKHGLNPYAVEAMAEDGIDIINWFIFEHHSIGDDFDINNLDKQEGEGEEEYYERKNYRRKRNDI